MQKIVDIINQASKVTRADYHLTLIQLIDALGSFLNEHDGNTVVLADDLIHSVSGLSSYRGHYSDLALEPCVESTMTVNRLLEVLNRVLNTELTGYKGGSFLMDGNTSLWLSNYGSYSGIAIIGTKIIKNTKGEFFGLITKKVNG